MDEYEYWPNYTLQTNLSIKLLNLNYIRDLIILNLNYLLNIIIYKPVPSTKPAGCGP